MKQTTVGLIVGNRGFFPDHLCETGRQTVIDVLEAEGLNVIALTPEDTPFGSVESVEDAHKCAELFKQNRDDIIGIIITLPNFGDERAIANSLRFADLNVPVLIQAFPDDVDKMTIADRRDAFCGKMSTCCDLRQYGIKYSLTDLHTVDPLSDDFKVDLQRFISICNVVRGLKTARIGAIGARPQAFKTVRYSEKLLEQSGISVETLDLYELFGWIGGLEDGDAGVANKLDEIKAYVPTQGIPEEALLKIAKLGFTIDRWMADMELDATAIQCWDAMEQFYGVVPCTIMSIMSNNLMPSACETDVAGVVGMYVMNLASGRPSAIVDWNNNYSDDPDKGVIFHCSNLPKDLFIKDIPVMDYQEIIAGSVGKENTFGTVVGRLQADPFTYCRVSTDDLNGRVVAYVGEGELTDDPVDTFGGYGVVKVPRYQELLKYICENGFEHHVAVNPSLVAAGLNEALSKYLGWGVYYHK